MIENLPALFARSLQDMNLGRIMNMRPDAAKNAVKVI